MSSRGVRDRLTRLERPLTGGCCPVCAHRKGQTVLIVEWPNGERSDEMPKPCERCGQRPETVVIDELVVMTREEDRIEHP